MKKEIIIERATADALVAIILVDVLKELLESLKETKITFANNDISSTIVENSDIYEQTLQSELGEDFKIFTKLIGL